MTLVHLTSSRFFGGPERQMLGLARAISNDFRSVFISFSEKGCNQPFVNKMIKSGFDASSLHYDTPRLLSAWLELNKTLTSLRADVLICHGYKAGLLGWLSARWLKKPVMGVSRGWTSETWRVKLYEALDRRVLRRMDRVVCVSRAQAEKVQKAGVPANRIQVIHNSIDAARFERIRGDYRNRLLRSFSNDRGKTINFIVGAAGRLSPEKGFGVLVDAAQQVLTKHEDVGFVLFGDGALKAELKNHIIESGIQNNFVLAGFTENLDRYMPHFDLFVQSSYTEGLPNVLLESLAAGVPVVATNVGGTSEVVIDGEHGLLVECGNHRELSESIDYMICHPERRSKMGAEGIQWVTREFTFVRQAQEYKRLVQELSTSK